MLRTPAGKTASQDPFDTLPFIYLFNLPLLRKPFTTVWCSAVLRTPAGKTASQVPFGTRVIAVDY